MNHLRSCCLINRSLLERAVECLLLLVIASSTASGDSVRCDAGDFVWSFTASDSLVDIELVDDVAYVLDEHDGLYIFRVSAGSAPDLLGRFNDPELVDLYQHMVVDGDRVYLNTQVKLDSVPFQDHIEVHLQILDASDPANLTLLATLEDVYSNRFLVNDGVMYSIHPSLGNSTLLAHDFRDPMSPVLIGEYERLTDPMLLRVVGDRLFVAGTGSKAGIVRILDLSDPTFSDPERVELGSFEAPSPFRNLWVEDDLLYISSVGELCIYDMSDIEDVSRLGVYDTVGSIGSFAVAGSIVCIASGPIGLEVVDVSDPSAPILLGTSLTPGYSTDIETVGDHAYCVTQSNGLQVISFDEPTTPLLGSFQIEDDDAFANIAMIDMQDGFGYVANVERGLKVIDFRAISSPEIVSTYAPEGEVIFVQVEGDWAYLFVRDEVPDRSGIHIVDIADPVAPTLVGFYGAEQFIDIEARDRVVYATLGDDALSVIDASDPAAPSLLSTLSLGVLGATISISDEMLYMVQYNGLESIVFAIDISDPSSPMLVSSYSAMPPNQVAYDIVANGDDIYVTTNFNDNSGASYPGGLCVFDYSDPTEPVLVEFYDHQLWYGWLPIVIEDTLYVKDSSRGLRLFDISDPLSVTDAGEFYFGYFMRNVAVYNGVAFIPKSCCPNTIEMVDVGRGCGGCVADLSGDGSLDALDVTAFIGAFADQSPVADLTGDGQYNFFDISAFIVAFSAGCP